MTLDLCFSYIKLRKCLLSHKLYSVKENTLKYIVLKDINLFKILHSLEKLLI